ncbi:tol-pal system protein YbgF [Crenobacter cavernae]|uniref:Cell division coordinator CpoB n=1 Tax=Crenobacter cavernae TaxID=2290923 RepID=A0A345Y412_9NEIS|nr:tol-pal system protein YbgF [Crenobacter cavernae]AXK38664.1 tol-pal system protein YbgF [Crenobacter cavernae]
MRLPHRLVAGGALLGLLAGCATTSDIEETRRQIDTVNQQAQTRLAQIETKLSNDKLLEMVGQIDSLRAEVARLKGEVEVQTYNLTTTQKRQNDLYNDLDGRLGKLESHAGDAKGSAVAPAVSAGAADTQASPDYERAMTLLKGRDFPKAIEALQKYLAANPDGDQAPDAQYWLGVAHTAQKQYDAAIDIHRRFADKYPTHPKAPDALRNIANCQRDLGQVDIAKATLKRLIKLYPKSDAAAKAKEQLAKL